MRPTEDDEIYNFIISGPVDLDKIYEDYDTLIKAIKQMSDRDDLILGEIKWKSNFRCTVTSCFLDDSTDTSLQP